MASDVQSVNKEHHLSVTTGFIPYSNYHRQQAEKVQHHVLTLPRVRVFTVRRVRNSIDLPACTKLWPSARQWDKLTHRSLNKLSSSCLLWQQTSARLYGVRQQATDQVSCLGRNQYTDTVNVLVMFWCHCNCQPHDAY